MGFVTDGYTKLNVPNTLLKKDIRDVSSKPQQKVFAVMSKEYTDDKYSVYTNNVPIQPLYDIGYIEV